MPFRSGITGVQGSAAENFEFVRETLNRPSHGISRPEHSHQSLRSEEKTSLRTQSKLLLPCVSCLCISVLLRLPTPLPFPHRNVTPGVKDVLRQGNVWQVNGKTRRQRINSKLYLQPFICTKYYVKNLREVLPSTVKAVCPCADKVYCIQFSVSGKNCLCMYVCMVGDKQSVLIGQPSHEMHLFAS